MKYKEENETVVHYLLEFNEWYILYIITNKNEVEPMQTNYWLRTIFSLPFSRSFFFAIGLVVVVIVGSMQ